MNAKQKRNAFLVLDALAKSSIWSPELRIGILCVLMKESGMIPRVESSYANTSNERIRKVFGKKKLGRFHENDKNLSILKKCPSAFFNQVYANVAGNRGLGTGDGYNYRGRGFNQITGRANYTLMQRLTGYALVKKPGMLRYPECAAKCVIAFFERIYKKYEPLFGPPGLYVFNYEKAVLHAAWMNAGIGKKRESTAVQHAYKNAMKFLPEMTNIYNEWEEKQEV